MKTDTTDRSILSKTISIYKLIYTRFYNHQSRKGLSDMGTIIWGKVVFRILIILTTLCLNFKRTLSDYIVVEHDSSISYVYHRM